MPHDDLYSVPYNPGTKQGICASLNNILYVEDRGSLFTHGGALSSHGKDVGLQLHERKKKRKIHKATFIYVLNVLTENYQFWEKWECVELYS